MQGYEGHSTLEPVPDARAAAARAAIAKLVGAVDLLEEAGLPCEVVTGGATGTYSITGANPRMTEIQAGSYALMDLFHETLVPGQFELALTVLATVVSRQGSTVVVDAGRKSVGIELVMPAITGVTNAAGRYFAEEHGVFDFAGTPTVDLGDRVEVVPGYGPSTVNLHDVFHVVEDGVVADLWPVVPRGALPGATWPSLSRRGGKPA
jgi:D-serine deaminase-like pyridoxal phosphate-dependent protein